MGGTAWTCGRRGSSLRPCCLARSRFSRPCSRTRSNLCSTRGCLGRPSSRRTRSVWASRSLVTEENHTKVSSASLNLLRQMLAFDPVKRITAADALDHPYFDNVRNDAEDITLSSDSDSDSGGVRFHAVRDQDVEFGIGWEESGPSSWIGYSSSDEDGSSSGFFGLGLVHRDDARKWSESS